MPSRRSGRASSARIAACFTTGPGLTALVGPSGVGKTSVLNMIAGLIPVDKGEIRFGGKTLAQTKIGYVFQFASLLPTLRLIDNVAVAAT